MRISDWSSDVCSSDLGRLAVQAEKGAAAMRPLVEVMHAQAVVVRQVMGLPRIAGQAGKALVGRAQGLDHGVSLPRCYEEEADVIGREVNPGRHGLTRGQRFFLAAGFFRLAAFFAALRTAFFLTPPFLIPGVMPSLPKTRAKMVSTRSEAHTS